MTHMNQARAEAYITAQAAYGLKSSGVRQAGVGAEYTEDRDGGGTWQISLDGKHIGDVYVDDLVELEAGWVATWDAWHVDGDGRYTDDKSGFQTVNDAIRWVIAREQEG